MGSSDGERKTGTVCVPSEIAQNLKAANEDAVFKYDESARNIVARKSVLAYILKSALDEYAERAVQGIAEKFIEGEPELRKIAVHQDHPDRKGDSGMISGDDAIRLLSKMFSTSLSYEDKLDALQNEFKISVSREMSEEVHSMCNP